MRISESQSVALDLRTSSPAQASVSRLRRSRCPEVSDCTGPRLEGAAAACVGRAYVRENKGDMANGTVKWFNSAKGYGFIQPDDGGKDVFVHVSAVERAGLRGLNEGQKVVYELQAERGRTAAVNLQAL